MSVVSLKSRTASRVLAAALLLSAATALSACSSISETNVHGIVVSESMLAKIKPGTSQQTVVEELGTPSTTSTIGTEAYYYITQTTSRPVAFMQPHIVDRTVLAVYFDKGKVARVGHYGIQDGAVFDFISRTTPTAGSERDFLSQLIRGMTAGVPGFSR